MVETVYIGWIDYRKVHVMRSDDFVWRGEPYPKKTIEKSWPTEFRVTYFQHDFKELSNCLTVEDVYSKRSWLKGREFHGDVRIEDILELM